MSSLPVSFSATTTCARSNRWPCADDNGDWARGAQWLGVVRTSSGCACLVHQAMCGPSVQHRMHAAAWQHTASRVLARIAVEMFKGTLQPTCTPSRLGMTTSSPSAAARPWLTT